MLSQQAQVDGPFDGLCARRHPELLVNRPQMDLDRVARDVQGLGDLQVRAGRQQPQDARLISGDAPANLGSRDVYCYFDNDIKVRAPFDAKRLMELLDLKWNP